MQKKFKINVTKIKGGCQSGRKVVTHNSMSDLPLVSAVCHHFRICRYLNTLRKTGLFLCYKHALLTNNIMFLSCKALFLVDFFVVKCTAVDTKCSFFSGHVSSYSCVLQEHFRSMYNFLKIL